MWKNYVCQQRKIKELSVKRSRAQVEIIMSMFAFLLVLFVMIFGWKISLFMVTGAYVEDALAASNLASALIDPLEYGKSYTLQIKDTEQAFRIYREALSVNLSLDEEGNSFQKELLSEPVKILSYIVYNVVDDRVEISSFDERGNLVSIHTEKPGEARTPDGIPVETTTVYSAVSFAVQGIGDQIIRVRKEKSVDIKRNEESDVSN